ncbi:MAG: HNH endonuclease [Geobacteraceae bacterium]|nr:HNH endonuclease [Geobacteraceae bacterium]
MSAKTDKMIFQALQSGELVFVSATGQVFSLKSKTPNKPIGAITSRGYLRTCVRFDGDPQYIYIHRVACIAAHGMPVGRRKFVNHKNGAKSDNRPENIEWMSGIENTVHARETGLYATVGRRNAERAPAGKFRRVG